MSKSGGGSGYIRLEKPDNAISQGLQFWGGIAANEAAEKRARNERQGIAKKKEVSDWEEKYDLKAGDFQSKYTGFKSFDEMNTDFSMYMSDEYVKLQRGAKDAMASGNMKEKGRLEGEMIRLKNAFGEASKSQQFFGDKYKAYQKAAIEGNVSGSSKDFEDIVQAAILDKNVSLRMVDGNLTYTGLKEGDNGKEPFTVAAQDIMDGSFSWNKKQQVSGEEGLVDNILSNLGKITREGTNGYYSISTQAWDDGKEKGIHSEATNDAIDALLGDAEVMGDLLYQFSGVNGDKKISKMKGFNDSDYKLVRKKLNAMVRAGYTEKFGKTFNSSKYATDSANAKKKVKDPSLSNLHYDADQFVDGDYTGLLGRHINEYDEEVNIREVILAPDGNYVIATTDKGERIEIPNTKRGFLEFKIRGKEEYKGLTPEKVMDNEPSKYRNDSVGGSPITSVANDLFDAEGKPTVDDEQFLERLNETFGITGEDNFTWSGNSLTINGKAVDTSSKEKFVKSMNKAIGKKKVQW